MDWLSRRGLLRAGAVSLLAQGAAKTGIPDLRQYDGFIEHGDRPLNLETPVSAFTERVTPTDRFFVRGHFRPPALGLRPWVLRVEGLVERPIELPVDSPDLDGFEPAEVTAVLQCAGNGRAYFEPIIPGVPWRKGGVGCGVWAGIRLRDVLERAGVKAGAAHVHVLGADPPPHPKTPPFLRSLPLERAMHPSTLLATRMNGAEMTGIHGGPLRLIVPGWTGNHWMKWVRGLVVSAEEAPGFYQRTGYRMPPTPVPPGTNVPPEQLVPVTAMNVKSLIAWPADGATLKTGAHELVGVAWAGMEPVERVEVAIDDGPWREARFDDPIESFAWRVWRFTWDAPAGAHVAAVRATDRRGETQPDVTPWNKSGYLWNGIDRVRVEVKA